MVHATHIPRFQTLAALYGELAPRGPNATQADHLIDSRHWFGTLVRADPASGDPQPRSVHELCEGIVRDRDPSGSLNDLLGRILDHAGEALLHIFSQIRSNLQRTHQQVPFHAAKELDSTCLAWLGRRSGRSIREKLADTRTVLAVRRVMSVDTAENRLLKEVAWRLNELLHLRAAAFPNEQGIATILRDVIPRWLAEDDAKAISLWTNLPPNNILLQDRYYRKIWDAWLWIEALDETLVNDQRHAVDHWLMQVFWHVAAKLRLLDGVRLLAQPCLFDSDQVGDWKIRPKLDAILGHDVGDGDSSRNVALRFDQGDLILACGPHTATLSMAVARQLVGALDGASGTYLAAVEIAAMKLVARVFPNRSDVAFAPQDNLPPNSGAVIDLSTVCPAYARHDGAAAFLPFLLLMQSWGLDKDHRFSIDLGEATAIDVSAASATISILDLTRDAPPAEGAALAADFFAGKIQNFLKCDRLTYVVPDTAGDFSLEYLRHGLNSHFLYARPLPRSIAALFHWLSERTLLSSLKERDCVLVVDTAGDRACMTLMVACAEPIGTLRKLLPESKGLYWEKHPSIDLGPQAAATTRARALLRQDKECPAPDRIADLMGFDGVRCYGSQVSWRDDQNRWYSRSEVDETALSDIGDFYDVLNEEISALHQRNILRRQDRIFVVLAGEPEDSRHFSLPDRNKRFASIWRTEDMVAGAQTLRSWQSLAGTIPLWQEYLPELSMLVARHGRFDRLHLVKQGQKISQSDAAVRIFVDDRLTLPVNGKTSYAFPLRQGQGGQAANYQLVLESPAFPLKEDVEVDLHLYFTYGSDFPYDLRFHPLSGQFPPIRAQWRTVSQAPDAVGDAPVFPPCLTWDELTRFPGRDREIDLLDWLKRAWDRAGEYLNQGDPESLDKFRKALRFPMLQIWNQGRSLSQSDCPEDFRHFVLEVMHDLTSAIDDPQYEPAIRDELLVLICYMHSDLSEPLIQFVRDSFDQFFVAHEKTIFGRSPFAFALGDVSLPWQQQMLGVIINNICEGGYTDEALRILSVSMWRSPAIIHKLSLGQLSVILNGLIKELARMVTTDKIKVAKFGDYCELILALLRSRTSSNPEIAGLLRPGAEFCRKIIPRMEILIETVCASNINIKTRLDLLIDKDESLRNVPDIIYAVYKFLICSDDMGGVLVAGVSDD